VRYAAIFALFTSFVAAQDQKCRIEGQVLSTAGAPLKKATVRLESGTDLNRANPLNHAATTDAEGKFRIENVDPGTYNLTADRTGYLHQYYGAKLTGGGAIPIRLDAGQALKDLNFKLTPQGMIFGRVVDMDGDPLPGVNVYAWRWAFVDGKKQLTMTSGGASSQADGSFVMGYLNPGRYYLSAEAVARIWDDRTQTDPNKPQESNLKTFFPDALDTASAAMIDVAAGAEVRGIEIHQRRGRVFSIRGKVELPRLPLLNGSDVMIGAKDRIEGMTSTDDKGAFQFKNILPGTYIVQSAYAGAEIKDATGEFSRTIPLAGRVEVTVEDRDVVNLVVPLNPGPEVRGHFKLEEADGTKSSWDTPLEIHVNSTDAFNYSDNVKKDGTFDLSGLALTSYRIEVRGLTGDAYVKAVSFNGKDMTDRDLDLTSGTGGQMEILISPNGAEVTGIVRDADGKAIPGAVVEVCGADGKCGTTANADQTGAFDLKGFAPGDYKLFAWEDRGDGVISDAGFRKSFESKAKAVKLEEKSRENVDLIVISKDTMDVEAAKIQ
jgi:protocatechuate 3,4-dioxygenase beta subunit